MIGYQPHCRFNRLAVLAMALLLSNIAMLSCAMAYAVCADCPAHPPALCLDSCGVVQAVTGDKAPDGTSGTRPPAAFSVTRVTTEPAFAAVTGNAGARNAIFHAPSPPLHLRFCVFLK